MKFPTDAEIQFQSKKLGPLIPVRVRTVIRLSGSPTHIRIPTHIRTDGNQNPLKTKFNLAARGSPSAEYSIASTPDWT